MFSLWEPTYLQRRPFNFPLHDETKTDKPIPYKRNPKECSRCTSMFRLSAAEYEETKNRKLFCIRFLQVHRCIKKLDNEDSHCQGIAILVLRSGVFAYQKRHNCSALNINANAMVNIFKENRKKIKPKRDQCSYIQSNKTLSAPVYCELFGDPHLKTFYDVRQTCIVAGAWSLLDNKYIAVQVTNDILQSTANPLATATSKVRHIHTYLVNYKYRKDSIKRPLE